VRIPGSSCLLQESWQVGPILRREEVATPGEQATDTHRILRNFIGPHRAIALFNPPANGTLTGIIGAIERFPLGSFPRAIARQAMPEIPPIQKQEPQTIRQTLVFSLLRRGGWQIAPVQRFQGIRLLPLSALDQFT
jgi:hypothetical protein